MTSLLANKNHPQDKKEKDVEALFFIVTLLLIFIMMARMPVDTDVWWHLRAGETTIQNGSPVLSDNLSFTHYGESWVNHSWLGQIILFAFFHNLQYWGLAILVALVASISFGLFYPLCKSPAPFRSILILFGVVVSAPVWSPRPQIFSLLLLSLTINIYWRYRRHGKKNLWILPILFAVWANLHAGFSLGIIYLVCSIIGEIINKIHGHQDIDEPQSWKKIFILAGWTMASGMAVLINPNGIKSWTVQFDTVGVQALQQLIMEWASPDFHDITQQPFLWLLVFILIIFALSPKRPNPVHVIQAAGFTGLGLLARRNIAPFALMVIPILDIYGWELFRDFGQSFVEKFRIGFIDRNFRGPSSQVKTDPSIAGARIINLMIASLLVVIAVLKTYFVGYPIYVESSFHKLFPVNAVSVITKENIHGNLLNEYKWGGYLDWFSRNTLIFVDGRTDLFGDVTIRQWINLIEANGDWEELIHRYQIDAVLLETNRPIIKELQQRGWFTVYEDDRAVIIQRR